MVAVITFKSVSNLGIAAEILISRRNTQDKESTRGILLRKHIAINAKKVTG